MRINVAGAGAGKTSRMASYTAKCSVPEGKLIFCIAFTHAAIDNIEKKVIKQYGTIPNHIKICTIHSFFYQEVIQPYYFLLYGTYYQKVSTIDLPEDYRLKNLRISELKEKGYLHQTKIPEIAKWVIAKKSGDKSKTKEIRSRILTRFAAYCYKVFVDEAQDIDKDMSIVLEAMSDAGVEIEMFGDPKQDVKGHNCYRELISKSSDVRYIRECHRCPQVHLLLSNLLAEDSEKQIADVNNNKGSIRVYFESEIEDIEAHIEHGKYGLVYISRKNGRFDTHGVDKQDSRFANLNEVIQEAIQLKQSNYKTDMEIRRDAYYVAERIMHDSDSHGDSAKAIKKWIRKGMFDYDKKQYAKICEALRANNQSEGESIIVKSIESIKGLEDEKCLFILTKDLAPYLFEKKTTDNKTKHLLYVALTRSKDELAILVTREVEIDYSKEFILSFIENTTKHNGLDDT